MFRLVGEREDGRKKQEINIDGNDCHFSPHPARDDAALCSSQYELGIVDSKDKLVMRVNSDRDQDHDTFTSSAFSGSVSSSSLVTRNSRTGLLKFLIEIGLKD